MVPVIISGGSGTRLWPLSRSQYPKQFCQLFDEPLQTMTIKRCRPLGEPWILTSTSLRTLTELNLSDLQLPDTVKIFEPSARNTGPAVGVLCKILALKGLSESTVGVFPSDHLIKDQKAFVGAVRFADEQAQKNFVVTLGIHPRYPETGYGYIQASQRVAQKGPFESFSVLRFHEKPPLEKAQEFLRQGGFSWNAGIFIFKTSVMIEHFKKHQSTMWKSIDLLKEDLSNIEEVYSKLPSISLDYAIMEHLTEKELLVVPTEMGWNDVGSWDAVAAEYEKSFGGQAQLLEENSKNNFVFSQGEKMVTLVGVEDLLLIDTADGLLVAKKGHSQDVKNVVDRLNKQGSHLAKSHLFEDRPWGRFEILRDTPQFKSKLISVREGAQISYQSHKQREEHWIVTAGVGEVILNDEVTKIKKGSYIFIPAEAKHRIRNTGKDELRFVEVQLGTYFGEDDITRYQDDYKRI